MKLAKNKGFENEQELFQLVSSLDLSNPEIMDQFEDWKHNDGSKSGLQKIIENNEEN